jgi:tetratricopeptide (TPR) repeat protein
MLWNRYHFQHDRSGERVPWGYGYNMFAGLEKNALIFTNGDNDTFPLWYQQEVERYRRDVRVLNLSLLNTDWYIRQLRDNEPKVAISWTNEQILDLHPIQDEKRYYQPRDLAVAEIIHENFGKRPIYFAVTIPRESLQDYEDHLVLEGLVYRLTTQKGKDMRDFAKLEENVSKVYRFDGILRPDGKRDDSVYRDSNQQSLIQNYAGAFVRLGQHTEELAEATKDPATRKQQSDRAVHYYKQALEISPDFDALIVQLGNLYLKLAQTDSALKMYEDLLRRYPGDERWRYKLAEAYLEGGRREEGMRLLGGLAHDDPDNDYVRQYMIQAYHELGRDAEAEKVLGEWESGHPTDKKMREFYGYVKQGLTGHLWGADGVTRQPPQTMPQPEVVDSETTRP